MKWVLCACGFLFFSSIGQAYLIGNLDPDELPPQSCRVELYTDSPKYFICSGSVIGKRSFVTAAHCSYGETIKSGKIFCPGEQPVFVSRIARHPSYRKVAGTKVDCAIAPYDVAVLTTSGDFSMEPLKLPANVDEATRLLDDPTDCNVYGYGLDENGKTGNHGGADANLQDWLLSTIVHTINGREVSREPVMGRLFCESLAHFKGKIIQSGDSGGALICKDRGGHPILAGVNQGNDPKSQDNIVTTFAKNLEWVKDQMTGSAPAGTPALASVPVAAGALHARVRAPAPPGGVAHH